MSTTSALCLQSGLQRVDGSQDHSEPSGTKCGPNQYKVVMHKTAQREQYHKEAKIVLMGEGRSFKYELDWSRARIPALAAVSPNRETGPI